MIVDRLSPFSIHPFFDNACRSKTRSHPQSIAKSEFRWKNSVSLSVAFLALIVVPEIAFPQSQVRFYVQGDANDSIGVEALQATIKVVPTPIVHHGVAAWIGFGYNEHFQIQTGWHRLASEPAPLMYFEYDDEDGTHFVQDKWQPTTTQYIITRNGNALYVFVNGFQISAPIPWTKFDRYNMCNIQVGVELLYEWNEHVPGVEGDTLDITGVSYRRVGGSYQSPSLSLCGNCNSSLYGQIIVSSSSVSIWDCRGYFLDACP